MYLSGALIPLLPFSPPPPPTPPILPYTGNLKFWCAPRYAPSCHLVAGKVDIIDDLSGSLNNAQALGGAGARPVRIAGALGGQAALRFSGGQNLRTINNIAMLGSKRAHVWMVVNDTLPLTGDRTFLEYGYPGWNFVTGGFVLHRASSGGDMNIMARHNGDVGIAIAQNSRFPPDPPTGGPIIIEVIYDKSTAGDEISITRYYPPGASIGTFSGNVGNNNAYGDFTLMIGAGVVGNNCDNDIGDVLVYGERLTNLRRGLIFNYLKALYF